MMKTKVPRGVKGNQCIWRFGKLVRYFDPQVDVKYGAIYNFDVHFSCQKREGPRDPVGVMLQSNGNKTQYNFSSDPKAPHGSWFFVQEQQ